MSLLCPSCRVDLVISERKGVEIDYCPKCRGVWLDRGELNKILDRAEDEPARARAPQGSVNASRFGNAGAPPQAPPPYSQPCHAQTRQSPPPQYRQRYRDDDDDDRRKYANPRKRKSWLSDIFD